MQDVETSHPFVSRDNISGRIPLRMPIMQPLSAGIREHVHYVELRFRRIEPELTRVGYLERFLFFPKALPLRLKIWKGILFSSLAHLFCDPGGATFGWSCHDANTFSCHPKLA